MEIFIYDSEGDGLLDEITYLHCFVTQSLQSKKYKIFVDKERWKEENTEGKLVGEWDLQTDYELYDLSELGSFLESADALACQNQFGFDLPVFEKLKYIDSYSVGPDLINGKPVRLFDTLVMSRGLYPDRPMPHGCPLKVRNSVTGKMDTVGPHGLAAWGYRVATKKPSVDDWRDQPLHVYVHRCMEDVKINVGQWYAELEEMAPTEEVTWTKAMKAQHEVEYRLQQQAKVGCAFHVERAKQLVITTDKMLKDIADEIEPQLPERELPKSKQPNFPAKPFKKDGSVSASGKGYAQKFGVEDEKSEQFIRDVQEGKISPPKLTAPMLLANQQDIKKYLFEQEGWEPTIIGTKDLTKDAQKRQRPEEELVEEAENYLMKTLVVSPYRNILEQKLGVKRGQGKEAFLRAVLKNARAVPMSPKFKDERGELCPSLEFLKGDMAKLIVKWLSLRSRRTTLLPMSDTADTGWLNDPRIKAEGRITAGFAGLTNTYRLRHKGIRNVPKADPKVLLGKEMRELFYAPEGTMFQTLDTSNMENMIAAWLAMPYDGGAYYELINHGDPHTNNAKAYSKAAGREVERTEGKNITYGVLYGAQKAKIAAMLGISQAAAQKVIDAFWESNEGLKGLKEYLEQFWESTGKKYIVGVDGRKLYTRSKHSLLNTLIQSTGAIMMNLAYVKVYDKLRDEGILDKTPITIYYHKFCGFIQ